MYLCIYVCMFMYISYYIILFCIKCQLSKAGQASGAKLWSVVVPHVGIPVAAFFSQSPGVADGKSWGNWMEMGWFGWDSCFKCLPFSSNITVTSLQHDQNISKHVLGDWSFLANALAGEVVLQKALHCNVTWLLTTCSNTQCLPDFTLVHQARC